MIVLTGRSWPDLDPLLRLAASVANELAGPAGSAMTPARERATLRLFGVEGLDRSGAPLAAAVVNRYLAPNPDRLASGIALPFAVALLEYEVSPQELALDVAAGDVDLGLEGELLDDPNRRSAAEAMARRLASGALARIDASRLARRDLRDVLGDTPRPWVGLDLDQPVLDLARSETAARIRAGADLLRVRVPAIRELVERLLDAGLEPPDWRHESGDATGIPEDKVPAGAQRALAVLRGEIDEAAAERGSYVRLMTVTSPLAAPEQATVAAFERVDLVEADPIAEIVEGGVDPARVLADHAFAHHLQRRAGTHVLVGPGPLVVGPDVARGVPSDSATRAGRALALQMVGIALARRDGVLPERIMAGAVPEWIVGERDPETQAFAQAALRRAAFPDLGLAFAEPNLDESSGPRWPYLLVSGLLGAGRTGTSLVLRRAPVAGSQLTVSSTRAAVAMAEQMGESSGAAEPRGAALGHMIATADVALATLELLAAHGWSAVLETEPETAGLRRSSQESVVERREPFDPFTND